MLKRLVFNFRNPEGKVEAMVSPQSGDIESSHSALFLEVLPMVSKWLEMEDLLLLRLVSKSCEQSTNAFLEAENAKYGLIGPLTWISRAFRWDYPEKVASFIEDTRGYTEVNRNPFVGRKMTINMENFWSPPGSGGRNRPEPGSEEEKEFWTNVIQISDTFGHHVRFLTLHLALSPLRIYKIIRELTGFMPNLRSIRVNGDVHTPTASEAKEQLRLLQEELCTNPPYSLPHLECLKLELSELPPILTNVFVTLYINQLEILTVDQLAHLVNFRREAANLKEFSLWDARYDSIVDNLSRLTMGRCPVLEKVTLFIGESEQYDLHHTFKILAKIPTITSFQISTELENLEVQYGIEANDYEEVVMIPSVKTVKIHHAPDIDYSFLLSFPQLERLLLTGQISWPEHPEPPEYVTGGVEEEVEVHRYIFTKEDGGFYRSNIWRLLPNLKTVRFEHVELDEEDYTTVLYTFRQFCTRNGYNQFAEDQLSFLQSLL